MAPHFAVVYLITAAWAYLGLPKLPDQNHHNLAPLPRHKPVAKPNAIVPSVESNGRPGHLSTGFPSSVQERFWIGSPRLPSTEMPLNPHRPTTSAFPGWSPPTPANVPPAEFNMMAEIFGQMLSGQTTTTLFNATAAPNCPPHDPSQSDILISPCASRRQTIETPAPVPFLAGAHGSQLPASPVTNPTGTPTEGIVGNWYCTRGRVISSLQITPNYVTISVTEIVQTDDNRSIKHGLTLVAEYQLTRNGTTAVGLITGVDMQCEGASAAKQKPDLLRGLQALQKVIDDKPFAFNVRVYGNRLVVNNVRLPDLPPDEFDLPLAALISGQYTRIGN